jgi:peptidyl-prolyl cis-trans isomerase A (cyclophilin A)
MPLAWLRRLYFFPVSISNNWLTLKERLMVTRFALILLCLSLAATGQTAAKSNQNASPKTAPKTATATATSEPTAILHTTAGDMTCKLFPDKAPKTVANFIGLANGSKTWLDPATKKPVHHKPLYDGVIFHRTIPGFVIQGGDPTGTGNGDVGFEFADELRPDLLYDQPGRLGMANHGPNTNSSQFFITEKEIPFLNPCLEPTGCSGRQPNTGWTIFGQCDDASVELVKKIARMPCGGGMTCTNENSKPLNPVKITHIEIRGSGKAAATGAATKKKTTPTKNAQPKATTPDK